MAGGLALGVSRTEAVRVSATEQRIEKIKEALGAYLILNGFLPCPALGETAIGDANFGRSDSNAGCTATQCTGGGCANIAVGVVPTATISLADEYMFDSWGRRITYAVDTRFTTSNGFSGTNSGDIEIQDYNGNLRADPSSNAGAVMVVISHGSNGHGAWAKTGGTSRIDSGATGTAEQENAETPATQQSFDSIFVQSAKTSDFDDFVHYMLRWQIIRFAGGIINAEECEVARRTLCPINATIVPARGPVGCSATSPAKEQCEDRQTRLARKINQLCFQQEPDGAFCNN